MATTSDIRNGMCIEYNNDIYVIVEFQHVKPGKGNAFVRTKLKSMTSGRTNENTWVAGHTLNEVRVERRKFQYLYKDEMGYNFMNTETFDQISVPDKMIENGEFLKKEWK
jgi:elongation factor P